jgi:hypothetical protein
MSAQRVCATPAAPTPSSRTRHPGRWFFITAAIALVITLVLGAIWSVVGLLSAWHAPDDFARTALPGTVQVSVTDPGTQYLYLEHPGDSAVPPLDELGVTVTGPRATRVAVSSTDFTVEYDAHAGDVGTAFATFQAAQPGVYAVTGTANQPGTSLAVGGNVADPLAVPLLGSAVLVGVGLVTATALVVLGLRRS